MTNYEIALKEEAKRCERGFTHYTSEQRADRQSSHRLGYQQRKRVGEAFWTHPAVSGVCFPTRKRAAEAAMSL